MRKFAQMSASDRSRQAHDLKHEQSREISDQAASFWCCCRTLDMHRVTWPKKHARQLTSGTDGNVRPRNVGPNNAPREQQSPPDQRRAHGPMQAPRQRHANEVVACFWLRSASGSDRRIHAKTRRSVLRHKAVCAAWRYQRNEGYGETKHAGPDLGGRGTQARGKVGSSKTRRNCRDF